MAQRWPMGAKFQPYISSLLACESWSAFGWPMEGCSRWNPSWPRSDPQGIQAQTTFGLRLGSAFFWGVEFKKNVLRSSLWKGNFLPNGVSIYISKSPSLRFQTWNRCSPLAGSWHASRRFMCHYCAAVRELEAGEPESLLFTAYGPAAAHRGTLHGSQICVVCAPYFFHECPDPFCI
jgi:hypothetical protein